MKKIYALITGIFILVLASFVFALELTDVGVTSNDGTGAVAMAGSLEGGFILETDGNAGTNYEIQFDENTDADDDIADGLFGLFLIDTTVLREDLKQYYEDRGTPEPYLSYLKDAVDGTEPFVYVDGTTEKPTLVDAAQHDHNGGIKLGMIVPGDYPEGTYVVQGNIANTDGTNNGTITLKLIIADASDEQGVSVTIGEDILVTVDPSNLDFGVVKPSESPKLGPKIYFNSSSSNVPVRITAQVSDNDLFEGVDLDLGEWTAIEEAIIDLLAGEEKEVDTRITIPLGTGPGAESGTITYTVTGLPPT